MHKQTENRPIGGIDSDSENRLLAPEDYRYALNISNSVGYENQFGVVTNIKGNVLIDNYTLPSGINKCIGSYYDRGENTTIYFVYNSLGQHKILRYYPSKTSNAYPYGTIQEIITFDFGWSDEEHITGIELVDGKLLYWTDSVKPRMINVVKGNITEKQKSWKVYLPKNYVQPFQSWGWNIYDMDGNQVFAGVFSFVGNLTREQAFEQIANDINASQNFLTAESCGCDLNVTETGTNQVYFDFAGNSNYKVVADNWYGLNLIDRYFDLIKWIPAFQPTYEWRKDSERQSNFVKNNVWQFRLQYIYDNNEESKLSPISNIGLNNISCNDQNYELFNYIKVDFNNSDVIDTNNWVVLKSVLVLYRIGNEGLWRDVVTLEPCDFYTTDGVNVSAEYDFYNDQITAAVSDSLVSVPFDNVPRKANALAFTQGRLVTGGALQGYDAPDCVDANLTVNVDDVEKQPTFKISFAVRIVCTQLDHNNTPPLRDNVRTNGTISKAKGFIWYRFEDKNESEDVSDFVEDKYAYYGGIVMNIPGAVTRENIYLNTPIPTPGSNDIIPLDRAIEMKQILPEGGFTAYCAGTDYIGITKQIKKTSLIQRSSDNAINLYAQSSVDKYKDFLINYINDFDNEEYDLFSVGEITVPPGRYVVRLAAAPCSFGDKLGYGAAYNLSAGRTYQRTSANVWAVDDSYIGGSYKNGTSEIVVEVTNSDVFIGEFFVYDLVFASKDGNTTNFNARLAQQGYILDNFGSAAIDIPSDFIPVDRAKVLIENQVPFADRSISENYTDHNGYFWIISRFLENAGVDCYTNNTGGLVKLRSFNDTTYFGNLSELLNDKIRAFPDPEPDGTLEVQVLNETICPTVNKDARNSCSTIIRGKILNSNTLEPIIASPIYTNGGIGNQNNLGEFEIIAWADTWNLGNTPIGNRIYDYLVLSVDDFCTITFQGGSTRVVNLSSIFANATTTPPPYSPTALFDLGIILANETGNVIIKSQKRGSFKRFGLRYSDEAGRYTTVIPVADIYIPFITEPLDAIGQIGVFKTGVASISWNIQQDAPLFASTYQWVRTKDRIYGKQLSWIVSRATYLVQTAFESGDISLPEIETSFSQFNAPSIKLSLTNIVDYYRQNNDSLVSYEFDKGDRLRLVADKNGVRYQQLIDFEIVNYETSTQSVVLKNNFANIEITDGCMIEIYNSLLGAETEEETWYEIGECYDVVNGQHSVTSGTFEGGDSYFRYRKVPVFEAGSASKYYVDIFECKTISDFYESEDEDIGRTGLVTDSLNQIFRPTLLQHSNLYLPNTQINGLSNFEPANEKELSVSYGELFRLVPVENTLISIHSKKIVSNYLKRQLVIDAEQASSLVASAEEFFGTDNPYMQDWGTQHAESVFFWNGYIYGADQRMTLIWRRANDGLNAISDYKAKSLFKSELVGRTSIIGQFDEYKNEAVFTLIGGTPAKTIAFFEPKNRWTTFYSFTPEAYGQSGNNIVSFVSGRIWLHDRSATYNNFYGVQAVSELWYIVNAENIAPKVWQAMYLEILNTANTNNWTIYEISNDNGQLSRIDKSSFVKKEAYWHSSFKRDLNTVAVSNPIINGRAMRSNMIVVKMRNDGSDLETLKGIVTAYQVSERITF